MSEKQNQDAEQAVRKAELEAKMPAKVAEEGDPNMTETEEVFLPIDRANPSDDTVVVGLNGRMYQIQRGKHVKVPRAVALILHESEEQDARTMNMINAMRDD